jgi:hypothetical protein
MADNLETPSISFGIVDSVEGIGSTELLNDLLGPETSTGDPDELKPIIKEVVEETPKKVEKPKGKEIVQTEEGKELTGQQIVSNFLGDNEQEDEELTDIALKEHKEEEAKEEEQEVSTFNLLAKDLFKLGVFTADEGEEVPIINSPEEFRDRFIDEKKKGAIEVVNNFIGQFGEDYQRAFDAIFVKGANPKEYFTAYNTIVDLANLDMTIEENQIAVIKRALTDQGFEPEDVTTEVDRLKNYGDLETVAAKHQKVLVKKDAVKLQQIEAAAEKELQQKAAIRNQYITNVQTILQEKVKNKEFDGIPLNSNLANELQDFLLVDRWKTTSGETLSDFDRTILELKRPENHAMKVKIALLLKILEKDPTLSTIQKSAVTKKTDQLFGEVARQVTKTKANVIPQGKQNSWFNNL